MAGLTDAWLRGNYPWTLGKRAIILLILLPVLVVARIDPAATALAVTGAAAFLGHVYPVYYGFHGGKGVATFYGAMPGFNWVIGLAALAVWLLMALVFCISALAALVSALCTPFIVWYFSQSEILTATTALMALLLYWRHRSNIKNMLEGKEHKIGKKKLNG